MARLGRQLPGVGIERVLNPVEINLTGLVHSHGESDMYTHIWHLDET
jgi:hypothetical protein